MRPGPGPEPRRQRVPLIGSRLSGLRLGQVVLKLTRVKPRSFTGTGSSAPRGQRQSSGGSGKPRMEALMSRRQQRSALLRQMAEAKRAQAGRLEQQLGKSQGELQSKLVYEAEELERRAKQFEGTSPGDRVAQTIRRRGWKAWKWARQRILRLAGGDQDGSA